MSAPRGIFRFPGRAYLLIVGVLVLGALSAPFVLIESTRRGPVTGGEVVLGIFPVLVGAFLAIQFRQTLTISIATIAARNDVEVERSDGRRSRSGRESGDEAGGASSRGPKRMTDQATEIP